MVDYAKAHPTKLSDGSVTVGSASRLTLEMLKLASGAHLTHVPYCGAAPALTDLIAGNIQAAFLVPGNVQQFVKDGRLKLIATSGAKRFESTPDIPTLVESGYPDLVAMSWIGVVLVDRDAAGVCRAALPALRRSGRGAIVNLSSCYGVTGRKGMGLYDASKVGLLALTRTLAHEEAQHGVRAKAVRPGPTLSEFHVERASYITGSQMMVDGGLSVM